MPRQKKNAGASTAIVRRVKDPDAHFMSVLISKCNIDNNTFLRGIYLDGVRQGVRNVYEHDYEREERREIRELLHEWLEHEFGVLPPWAIRRLAAAKTETLVGWSLGMIGAERLEDVFSQRNRRCAG